MRCVYFLKQKKHTLTHAQEVVLAQHQDRFFADNMCMDFGELGAAVKRLMATFQSKTTSHEKLDSISDIQKFLDHYPEFRRLSGNVNKHVTLTAELARIVGARGLMDISETEQDLACSEERSTAVKVLTLL